MDNQLKSGTTLRFTEDITFTRDPDIVLSSYLQGDLLYLIEPTGQDPHGYRDTDPLADRGVFWKVKSKHGVSVWTRINLLLENGILEVKEAL